MSPRHDDGWRAIRDAPAAHMQYHQVDLPPVPVPTVTLVVYAIAAVLILNGLRMLWRAWVVEDRTPPKPPDVTAPKP